MAGVRHHILPRFLLKGFVSRTCKKSQYTWLYRKNNNPVEVSLKDVNIEKHFYGREGEPYVDPEITDIEQNFAPFIDKLRLVSSDIKINDEKILQFISHILIRTKNARDSLHEFTDFFSEELPIFSDTNRMKEPLLKLISKHLLESIHKNQPDATEQDVLRLHKTLNEELRNNFEKNSDSIIEGQKELLQEIKSKLPEIVKHKHNELIKNELVPNDMIQTYQYLNWYVWKTTQNLIISDSGCITETNTNRRFKSHEFNLENIVNVYFPIESKTLIVGTKYSSLPSFNLKEINKAMAKCGGYFFICSENSPSKQELSNSLREWFGFWTKTESTYYINKLFDEMLDNFYSDTLQSPIMD